jgi:hypothetical protein
MSITDSEFAKIVAFEGQQKFGGTTFPVAYVCGKADATLEEARAWIADNSEELLATASRHGAVLFRGFPADSVEAFDALVCSLGVENFPYKKSLSNAVRVNRTERVFSANEAPPEVQIYLHHEMAQTPLFPAWIMFYCEVAAETGGASPLCRSDVLYDWLKEARPEFIRACEEKGLRYTNVMPGESDGKSGIGRSWKDTLGVETREAAEKRLADLNYSWEWLEDGCLRATTPPLPAVMEVSPGRKTFFNQLIAAYRGWKDVRNDPSKSIRHGDGSELDAEAVGEAIRLADELTFTAPWQVGDFVVVDNRVAMHARQPFTGKRKVVASLAVMQTHSFTPAV